MNQMVVYCEEQTQLFSGAASVSQRIPWRPLFQEKVHKKTGEPYDH